VEALRRSGDSGAEIRCALRGDAQPSVCRSSGDAENQTQNGLACVDAEAVNRVGEKIEHETKSSASRGRVRNETGREIKSSGRRNRLTDEAERAMRSDERPGSNAISQTRADLSDRNERLRSGK
jgi:hypothetical protein